MIKIDVYHYHHDYIKKKLLNLDLYLRYLWRKEYHLVQPRKFRRQGFLPAKQCSPHHSEGDAILWFWVFLRCNHPVCGNCKVYKALSSFSNIPRSFSNWSAWTAACRLRLRARVLRRTRILARSSTSNEHVRWSHLWLLLLFNQALSQWNLPPSDIRLPALLPGVVFLRWNVDEPMAVQDLVKTGNKNLIKGLVVVA